MVVLSFLLIPRLPCRVVNMKDFDPVGHNSIKYFVGVTANRRQSHLGSSG